MTKIRVPRRGGASLLAPEDSVGLPRVTWNQSATVAGAERSATLIRR